MTGKETNFAIPTGSALSAILLKHRKPEKRNKYLTDEGGKFETLGRKFLWGKCNLGQ
jgi:hypothetical protein